MGEAVLNFLYNGTNSYNEETEVSKILFNLIEVFGFPENLFSISSDEAKNMELEKESPISERHSEEIIDLAISDEVNMIYQNFKNTPSRTETTQNLLKISRVMSISSNMVETNQDINTSDTVEALDIEKSEDNLNEETDNDMSFTSFNSIKDISNKIDNENLKSDITVDNKRIQRISSFNQHVSSVEEGMNSFLCKICGKKFNRKDCLRKHNKLNHKYKCQACSKKFVRHFQLENHIDIVHEKKKFKCKICTLRYISKYELDSHIESIHVKGKPQNCLSCDKEFKTLSNFKQHVANFHDKRKPY